MPVHTSPHTPLTIPPGTLITMILFLNPYLEVLSTDLLGHLTGTAPRIRTTTFHPFVNLYNIVTLVLAVFDTVLAEVLGFPQLTEFAAGEAQVVLVAEVVGEEGLTVSWLRFWVFLLLHGFEADQVVFLAFHFARRGLGLTTFAGLLNKCHKVLVIISNNIDLQTLKPLKRHLNPINKLLSPHIAIIPNLQNPQIPIKKILN